MLYAHLSNASISVLSLSAPAPVSTSTTLPSTMSSPLSIELQMYRRWDAEAQRDFAHASSKGFIGITKTTPSTDVSHNQKVIFDERDCEKKLSVMERELVRLRRENESLIHDLLFGTNTKTFSPC
ncbi:hypothetical protein LSM04_003426 [Trypanosoma melophagium]|uniref:uncharacterized protein n=1 Tax=Trypanosoma melophagium TaxID=715481 RepID=UPI00351A5265|nr:hypothetical protein LSM04_003426 [Trypanosoma melophagium]